jgi:cytochrome bd ubiquinol oxidase subunit I
VALSGVLSGIFVVIANAWMNTPTGFTAVSGQLTELDPIRAMLNPAAFQQTLHMTLAAYAATGLAVSAVHAAFLLGDPMNAFHRRALQIALMVGTPAALLQPVSGDISARNVAEYQPAKLAAMESLFETRRGAPLLIGGLPDIERREVRFGIEIPYGLSLMAYHDPHAEVKGLDQVPREDWPHVTIVHLAFQTMVGLGSYMALLALWVAITALRRREISQNRTLLKAIMLAGPMGFLAIEAGWVVTEVGRQPWIITGVLKTAEAVTPMPGLIVTFTLITLLYLFLGSIVAWMLYSQIIRSPVTRDWSRTYAPGPKIEVKG